MNRIIIHAGGSYIGGMEIVLLDLMKYLKGAGWEPYAVVSWWNNGDYISRLKKNDIQFICSKAGNVMSNPLKTPLRNNIEGLTSAPGALFELRQLVKQVRPAAIVQTSFTSAFVSMPFVSDICSNHILHLHDNAASGIASFRGRPVADKCRRIICVSEFVASEFRPHVSDPSKIVVVRNGTPCSGEEELAGGERGGVDKDKLRVSIVGQIIERKNHRLVIEALEKLASRAKRVVLNIFGDSSTKFAEVLKAELANKPKLYDVIRWRGFERNPAEIYRQPDVIVAASLDEPF